MTEEIEEINHWQNNPKPENSILIKDLVIGELYIVATRDGDFEFICRLNDKESYVILVHERYIKNGHQITDVVEDGRNGKYFQVNTAKYRFKIISVASGNGHNWHSDEFTIDDADDYYYNIIPL